MATTHGLRHMNIDRARVFSILISAIALGDAGPAMAQACTREGPVVNCDDGRRGLLSGEAIVWPDGTRSSLSPHPSVIIGNKSSVQVGPGVFVGPGKAWCRWTIRTRRTRHAALFSTAHLAAYGLTCAHSDRKPVSTFA